MSLKQPYEILIADKLQQLPVPDMADAIWSRIELQLDAPAIGESTEPAKPVHPNSAGSAAKTAALVGGGLIALVVLFFIINKSTKRTEKKKLQPPIEQTDSQKLQPSPATAQDTVQYRQPVPLRKTDTKPLDSPVANNVPIVQNNAASQLPLTMPQKDSAALLNLAPRISTPKDSSMLQTVPKKPRGIQIPENGYKMKSSKRDST